MFSIIIQNHGNISIDIDVSTMTLLDLKKLIIKECELDISYIDIECSIDRPIRVMGKFNTEAGIIPRTLDRYDLIRFAFTSKPSITVLYHLVNDYVTKEKDTITSNSKYIPPYKKHANENKSSEQNKHTYDIKSLSDFPTL